MKRAPSYNRFFIYFLPIFLCLFAGKQIAFAQVEVIKDYDRPRNVKILREFKDDRGNMIREIQYSHRSMRVTEMIILPKVFTGVGMRPTISLDSVNRDSIWLMINKSNYCVQIYYKKRLVKGYKAVFGPDPKLNKCMEGDRCTPEGWYKIADKRPSNKYNKFLLLNYPNEKNQEQFNKLKELGKIPKTARIGGDVGIHGIWPRGDDMIEMGIGWTDGCIALKNDDVDDLYKWVRVGTRVYIKK